MKNSYTLTVSFLYLPDPGDLQKINIPEIRNTIVSTNAMHKKSAFAGGTFIFGVILVVFMLFGQYPIRLLE